MNWQQRIAIDPKILVGKPVIRGTRLVAKFVVCCWRKAAHKKTFSQTIPVSLPKIFTHVSGTQSSSLRPKRSIPWK